MKQAFEGVENRKSSLNKKSVGDSNLTAGCVALVQLLRIITFATESELLATGGR